MVHIQKKLPSELSILLKNAENETQWLEVSTENKQGLRFAFDDLAPKEQLRKVLFQEQKGLCAYCMRHLEIDKPTGRFRLEHRIPLSTCKIMGLDYQNLLTVCEGGENKGNATCCDIKKADQEISFNPCERWHIETLSYKKSGDIVSSRTEFQSEIDFILCLNGKLDKKGNRISDTNTRLVEGRRETYKNCEKMYNILDKKKQLNSNSLQKLIFKLEQQEKSDQYIGVTLYFYRKKLKSLLSQNK